jgi:hypothetical protein
VATYNIGATPACQKVMAQPSYVPGENAPTRMEWVFDCKQQAGLAVGDQLNMTIKMPPWAGRVVVQKRTDTANADILTAQAGWPSVALPAAGLLPGSDAQNAVSGVGYLNSAGNSTTISARPMGEELLVGLQLVTSVPGSCLVIVVIYQE